MGQASDSRRNASLDQQKTRAAGRSKNPARSLEENNLKPGEHPAGGAFGTGKGPRDRRGSNLSRGSGGGGATRTARDRNTSGAAAAGRKTQAVREIEGSRELVNARQKAAKTAGKTPGARGAKKSSR